CKTTLSGVYIFALFSSLAFGLCLSEPTNGGSGVGIDGGGVGYSNGNHHGGGGGDVYGHVTGPRPRRSRPGRSRDYGSGSDARVPHQQQQEKEKASPPCTNYDVAYFHSYAHLGIHEEMIKFFYQGASPGFQSWVRHPYSGRRKYLSLDVSFIWFRVQLNFDTKDRVRTETYRDAIFQHQEQIAGKVVVDVGCGTGILSIFCARAGARRVYAVDASDIAVQGSFKESITCCVASDSHKFDLFCRVKVLEANEVIKANNLSETIIVLHGRVEDVEIEEKVDVIVSEWMGYMLLYESMLGSVITARDRWLKPGGLMLPSFATLYMAPVSHPDRYTESIDFWRNVYEIDMSVMMPLAKQCAFEEPSVKHVDCCAVTIEELESISTRFKFQSMMRAPFHGFAFWFDVEFGGPTVGVDNHVTDGSQRKKRPNPNDALVLSTAPENPPTHWQQ
ncbi:protein arginine n-methyltransferase, partial [Striga asiatica]